MKTDDGDLYNPDNYGGRKRAVGLLLVVVALLVAPCALLGWWIA